MITGFFISFKGKATRNVDILGSQVFLGLLLFKITATPVLTETGNNKVLNTWIFFLQLANYIIIVKMIVTKIIITSRKMIF